MASYPSRPDQGPSAENPAGEEERIPWWVRAGLVVTAMTLGVLLVTAARLEPDPRGHGTHEQLGLLPCWAITLWKIRCPACGMTTAWARALHGDAIGALRANLGGVLLLLASVATIPWALWSAVAGRWAAGVRPGDWLIAAVLVSIVAITIAEWIWRLAS